MENDNKLKQAESDDQVAKEQEEIEVAGRRKFLRSLGKWSMAVIGGVIGSAALPRDAEAAWINRRGGWLNGGGGGWINRGGGWINGGGGGWANRVAGGGWLNNRGGGGWLNRRW
ncbi:MAG: hypothetical protein AB7U82_00720 [Blastocatellales bacterium]